MKSTIIKLSVVVLTLLLSGCGGTPATPADTNQSAIDNGGSDTPTTPNTDEPNVDNGVNGTLTNGLIAHYEFEGNANDSSGNGNNGTEHGGVSYVDSVIGKGISLDGINDYVSISESLSFPLSDNNLVGSVCYWAKGSGTAISTPREDYESSYSGHRFGYISNGNTSEDDYFRLTLVNTSYEIDNTFNHRISKENIENKNDKINHYCIAMDGINNTYTFFINGISETIAHQFDESTYNPMERIEIGIYNNGSWGKTYYEGIIDDMRIYNKVLNASEVNELYNMKQQTPKQPPVDNNECEDGLSFAYVLYKYHNSGYLESSSNEINFAKVCYKSGNTVDTLGTFIKKENLGTFSNQPDEYSMYYSQENIPEYGYNRFEKYINTNYYGLSDQHFYVAMSKDDLTDLTHSSIKVTLDKRFD